MAAILLADLFVVALAALWLNHARQQDFDAAAVATRNLSSVLEHSIAGTVRGIDLALLAMADAHAVQRHNGRAGEQELNRRLAQQLSRLPELVSLRMTDAQGVVRLGPGVLPGATVSVADRDYYTAARDAPQAGLIVSKPMFARISKQWVLVFARRLSHADGSFAGVVYANLALEHLAATFAALDVGRHGALTLRGADLGVIVRHPEPLGTGSTIGSKVVTPEFKALIAAGQSGATFTVRAGIDQIERTNTYRRIGAYPLYVIAGMATEGFLARWHRHAAAAAALVALFVVMSLLSARLLFGAWKRQAAATADALDVRILRRDGATRWLAHACRLVCRPDGTFFGRRASNRDITDRKTFEEQVQQLAYFDTLTGLPNRRMLHDRLARALSQAKRHERALAIMFLDLDNFKRINDTLGHDVGDELLTEVAVRLETCVRSGDTVARQGGDEFIIVLAEIAEPQDAARVATKILAVLGTEPVRIAEQELQVTTSIGIAVYPINGTDDIQELLKKADKAMYAAKAAGRNGYRFFDGA